MDSSSLVLIGLFFLAVNIPCLAIVWIGMKFFDQIGRHPSKTAAIQMSIVLKLAVIEVAAFTAIMMLFKILSPEQ